MAREKKKNVKKRDVEKTKHPTDEEAGNLRRNWSWPRKMRNLIKKQFPTC